MKLNEPENSRQQIVQKSTKIFLPQKNLTKIICLEFFSDNKATDVS